MALRCAAGRTRAGSCAPPRVHGVPGGCNNAIYSDDGGKPGDLSAAEESFELFIRQ